MAYKKETAGGTCVSSAEINNNYMIAENDEKVKDDFPIEPTVHTNVAEITKYQHCIIGAVYRSSKSLDELVNKLSKLKFCDVMTACDSLIKQEYISTKDKEYIIMSGGEKI